MIHSLDDGVKQGTAVLIELNDNLREEVLCLRAKLALYEAPPDAHKPTAMRCMEIIGKPQRVELAHSTIKRMLSNSEAVERIKSEFFI